MDSRYAGRTERAETAQNPAAGGRWSPPLPDPLPPALGMHFCGAWWTGRRRAHCAACHATFGSESAAERHRRTVDGARVCADPADAGLVPAAKPWGVCWTLPASGRPWWTPAADSATVGEDDPVGGEPAEDADDDRTEGAGSDGE